MHAFRPVTMKQGIASLQIVGKRIGQHSKAQYTVQFTIFVYYNFTFLIIRYSESD